MGVVASLLLKLLSVIVLVMIKKCDIIFSRTHSVVVHRIEKFCKWYS